MLSRYTMYRRRPKDAPLLPDGIRKDTRYATKHVLRPTKEIVEAYLADPTEEAPSLPTSTNAPNNLFEQVSTATLTMVLDPRRGIDLLESLPGCEGYLVSKTLEVTKTSGFPVV